MNLLNNVFNNDDLEIVKLNKKYSFITIILIVIILALLIIEKDNHYLNSYSVSDDKIILLVEKEYVNDIKKAKEIIISDIKCGYSINEIIPVDNSFFVSINLNTKIKNISSGIYKINLGKERLFDYIVRIVKK